MSIAENIARIKKDLPANVTLVAAVKYAKAAQIKEITDAGVLDLGFNTYQQMRDIKPILPPDTKLHFIGHLQKNKVNDVLKHNVTLIQSVDSYRLAEKINSAAEKLCIKQDILLEVKTDKNKEYGCNPDEAEDIIMTINSNLHNINVRGLMTVPPESKNTETYFAAMKKLYGQCISSFKKPAYLSMGMSDDYKLAVQCGSNMVRIGRAIFS